MESLHSLGLLKSLLDNSNYEEALQIIEPSIEVLAPYVNIGRDIEVDSTSALVLAKLFLIQKDYARATFYALQGAEHLHTLNKFYYEAILYRMMEHLLLVSNSSYSNDYTNNFNSSISLCTSNNKIFIKSLRAFIVGLIKDDPLDDNYIGFLAEIGEFELLKNKIREMANKNIDCRGTLDIILDRYYKEVFEVFLEPTSNEHMIEYVIDILVMNKKTEELKNFISGLPWEKLYYACFYIEDTHHLDISLEGNSNTIHNCNFILSGDWKQEIMSNFLFRSSKSSFRFLESLTKVRAPYISLCNCIMNAGTTNDSLYRNNKNLLGGKEWTRFIEFSSLGMIHQGNIDPFEILKEILPSLESSSGEPGALMALGIMNAKEKDKDTTEFLLNWLDNSSAEMVYGACMGLGLNMMESKDASVTNKLKILFAQDNTIFHESALYALGLIYANTGDSEMIEFIRSISEKTDFPRVKRVCGIALSLIHILYDNEDKEEENDSGYEEGEVKEEVDSGELEMSAVRKRTRIENTAMIDSIVDLESRDDSIRFANILSLGAANVATSDLNIIQKLLPFINDGDDDVKRATVIAIGLIAYGDVDIRNTVLVPLAQNHNLYVRSTIAIMLGFLNCGIGDNDICNLQEALLYDSEQLVRQSACVGVGFSLVQMNPTLVANYKRILDRVNSMLSSKGESSCVKIGASIGRSIAEMAGRSAIFSLRNFTNQIESKKVAGFLLFINSWYWYPLIGSIGLCLTPTPIFFFNEKLDETEDTIDNDPSFYDLLVKLPEIKKSRKFKQTKVEVRDTRIDAPSVLKSGDRMTFRERNEKSLPNVVIFK